MSFDMDEKELGEWSETYEGRRRIWAAYVAVCTERDDLRALVAIEYSGPDRSRADAQVLVGYRDAYRQWKAGGRAIDGDLVRRMSEVAEDGSRRNAALDRLTNAGISLEPLDLPRADTAAAQR